MVPEKPDSSNEHAARGNRRGRRRLPVLPIVLLLVVAFLILAFVTFRQLRSAREHRLRLLAGFSDRIEQTIPRRAARFARIIQEQKDPARIEEYVRIVPQLQLVGEPRQLGEDAETPEEEADRLCTELTEGSFEGVGPSYPCLVLRSHNDQIELTYVGVPGEAPRPPSTDDRDKQEITDVIEPTTAASGERETGDPATADGADLRPPHIFFGRIELRTLLREILVSDVFDNILVASARTGRVLHQEGEPALVVADLASLLTRAEPAVDLKGEGPATTIVDVTFGPADGSWIGEGGYKLFLQPVSLDRDLPRNLNVASEEWVAAGLISDENLLASGFSTSPLLLFALVASFPFALISWPFLKLWLISPRQSMTRLDLASLVAASVLCLTLVALLAFDVLFLSRLHAKVDKQLSGMALALKENLLDELTAMQLQLDEVHDLETKWDKKQINFDQFKRPASDAEAEPKSALQFLDDEDVKFSRYPYLHSIFWANDEGEQTYKLPLREYAVLKSSVNHRVYFQCARQDVGYRIEGVSGRVCLEAIFSNTTGRDLVALARPSGDHVAVLTGVLLSLRRPVLAPGFGFAVVDESGQAVFHSDERRNMTEDFLKASDENQLLAALLAARRPGHLTVNYWGRRSRLYLRPLSGLPWTVVAFRSGTDLRLRNFEMVYDFLAAALPYLLVVMVVLLLVIYPLRTSLLWPAARHTGLYRLLVLLVALQNGLLALVIAFAGRGALFGWSLAVPIVTVLVALLYLWLGRDRTGTPGDEPERGRYDRFIRRCEWPALGLGFVSCLVAACKLPGFITGFMLLSASLVLLFWVWLKSFFLGRQRRMAFIAALGAMFYATALLPAVGFFSLAQSRQLQYLVQDSQAGLAHSIHARQKLLADTRVELASLGDAFFAGYKTNLETGRERLLESFYGTRRVPPSAYCTAANEGLWPVSRGDDPPLSMKLLSARPVSLSEIARNRSGLDLSRFEGSPHSWRLREGEQPLLGRFQERWETGPTVYLASDLYPRTPKVRWLRRILVASMLLLLVPLPVLLARFLADRVLLARLATADSAPSTLGARLTGWQGRVDLRRVLLVTSVPELAVREAKRSGAYRVETFKAPPPSRADDGSPGGGDDDAKEGEET